jgi:hypothetical protein
MHLNFLNRFLKKYSNIKNIHPMSAEMFHADGHTYILMLTVTFCNFTNVPKNIGKSYIEEHASVSYFQYMHKNGMQKCYPPFHSIIHMGMLHDSNNCAKKNPVHKICLLTYRTHSASWEPNKLQQFYNTGRQ